MKENSQERTIEEACETLKRRLEEAEAIVVGAGAGVEKKAEDDRRGQPVLQGKIMAFDGRVRAPFVPCQLEIAHVRYPCGCPVVPFPD